MTEHPGNRPSDFGKRVSMCGLLLLVLHAANLSLWAGDTAAAGEFVNRIYEDDQGQHKYVVFVPHDYSSTRTWPTIVWLHGASARGQDGRTQLVAGLGPNVFLRRESFPFLVVFPQCENLESRLLGGWTDEPDDADRALRILQQVEQDYRVDPERRILAGVSMGAFGVWSMAARTPELWSAIVPVSGGGPASLTKTLEGIPVWAFHAADDQVVPPSASKDLVQSLVELDSPAHYTELPNGGHNIGSRVFAKDEIYAWLLNPRTQPEHPVDWPIQGETVAQLQEEVPFVPGAEMDRAVQIQIGSDLLDALAHSLPKQVPADALRGTRGPQSQRTGEGWTSFQVTASGVSYSGEVQAARLEPLPENQLRVRIGIQPLTMTVHSTQIQGRILRANAGAMNVVIGVRRPAWLSVVVRPEIVARQLKLHLVSADFPLEQDNWYVTRPNGVDVFPLPMLRDRVSQRLTDGLYAKQGEIEQQIVAGVPKLLEQIEQQAEARFNRVVTFGQWPMPVWQPRAKFWPSDLAITPEGITVSLGATMAALAPQGNVVVQTHPGPTQAPRRIQQGVQIAMSKDLVETWTRLLASSRVRRFHVQDFHSKSFQRLADREFLARVMPGRIDPAGMTELRSVLSFEQPLQVSAVSEVNQQPDSSTFRLAGQELRLTISERLDAQHVWAPVAEFPIAWHQDFSVVTRKLGHRSRRMEITSRAPLKVRCEGRSVGLQNGSQLELDPQLIADQFQRGWEDTFATALAREIRIPERVIAEVPLLCDECALNGEFLVIRLTKPTTQIRNLTGEPLTYEVRAPGSGWSDLQTLPPGMMHEYQAASPLTWRSRSSEKEYHFTLPLGSVSHYRGGEQPLRLAPEAAIPKAAQRSPATLR